MEESLNSVLNQTFKDFEVICVNDGSTDKSLNILNDFKKKDDRIRIISQKNHGNGGARNTGLKNATGEYVYFFDADDLLFSNALEKMHGNAINNDSDLTIFKITLFYDKDHLIYNNSAFPFDKIFKNNDFSNFTFNSRCLLREPQHS